MTRRLRWLEYPVVYIVYGISLLRLLILGMLYTPYMFIRSIGEDIWFQYIRPWLKKQLDD